MPRRFLGLREFDLKREHHANDAAADVAQRAMMDAHRRHQRAKVNHALIVGGMVERYARKNHISDPDPEMVRGETGFGPFLLRSLKLDTSGDIWGDLWAARAGTMSNADLADMIRACLPAAIDEWEQERRYGRERVNTIEPEEIERQIREIVAALRRRDTIAA